MFIGHFAVGFASKRAAPGVSLGLLMTAPLLLDLLWPIGLVTGLESVRIDPGNTAFTPLDLHDYPYSHSLLMAAVWSLLFGGGYFLFTRDRRAALVIGLGVFSHWILDFVTHRPDMPLYPGSSIFVGLGLWHSRVGTIVVELLMFAVGVGLYARVTRAKNRVATVALIALVSVLLAIYLGVVFSPPPPSVAAVEAGAFLSWLFPLWAWRVDRRFTLAPA